MYTRNASSLTYAYLEKTNIENNKSDVSCNGCSQKQPVVPTRSKHVGPFMRGIIKGCIALDKSKSCKSENIEFGLFSGSSSTTNHDIIKNIEEDTNIDNSTKEDITLYVENIDRKIREKFVTQMSKVVQESAVTVVNENKQQFKAVVSAANVVNLNNIEGDKVVLNLSQSNEASVKVAGTAENKTMNDLNTKITNTTVSNILDKVEEGGTDIGDMVSNVVGEAAGVVNNAVDQAAGVANNVVDTTGELGQAYIAAASGVATTGINAAAGVATSGINALAGVATAAIGGVFGNSTNTNVNDTTNINRSTDIDNSVNRLVNDKTINEKEDRETDKIDMNEELNNAMDKMINNESVQECVAEVSAVNEVSAGDIKGKDVEINLDQENKLEVVLACMFKNETTNKIVEEFIKNVETKAEKLNIKTGDIEAAGIALAGAVNAAGDAAATAAEGVGTGAATAAEGVGKMFSSMTFLLIGLGLFAMIAMVMYLKFAGII